MTRRMYGMKSGGARNGDLSLCAQGMKICPMLCGLVLMASNSDGTIHIDTPLLPRLLGKPPHHGRGYDAFDGQGRFRQRHPLCWVPCRACWWWPLQSRCHSRQSHRNSVPNSSWRRHHSQLAIHQSTSVTFQLPLWAGDEKGRAANRGFPVLPRAFQAPKKLLRSLMG